MTPTIRLLGPDDLPALERFFARHPHTTLFFQGNLLAAGFVDHGEAMQGTYAGAFENGDLVAVAACFWQGNLALECPRHLEPVARLALARSGRPLRGLLGPDAQVAAARRALGVEGLPASLDSHEDLFALSLDALRVPEALASGRVRCRAVRDAEVPLVTRWRVAYGQEILGARPGPELDARSVREIEGLHALGRHWLLEDDGGPLAYAAFNAATPRCVQVGGVYTPPELRRRGHARCVVAGTLLEARASGVADAVLFTDRRNVAAKAAYRALGFERVGDYALVLFPVT